MPQQNGRSLKFTTHLWRSDVAHEEASISRGMDQSYDNSPDTE